jgi:hypothetical protein
LHAVPRELVEGGGAKNFSAKRASFQLRKIRTSTAIDAEPNDWPLSCSTTFDAMTTSLSFKPIR